MVDLVERIKAHIPALPDGSPSRPLFEEAITDIEHLKMHVSAVCAALTAAHKEIELLKPKPKKAATKPAAKKKGKK